MRPSSITRTRSASLIASSTSWVDQQDGRLMLPDQAEEQFVHLDPRQRVERAERLVGQEQARLAHQRTRQRHPLLLAAG